MRKYILAVLVAGIWVNISEFARAYAFMDSWSTHYTAMNVAYPPAEMKMWVWIVWGFLAAGVVAWLATKFDLLRTAGIAWISIFLLTTIAMLNIAFVPMDLALVELPWTFVEMLIAAFIARKILGDAGQ